MLFSKLISPLALATMAASAYASPVAPALVNAETLGRRVLVDARTVNEKRTEATFDLGHSWSGTTLFDGNHADGHGGTVGIDVVCKTCYTNGSIGASITNLDALTPTLRIDFSALEAYVDLAVAVTDAATYTINLFTSNTPLSVSSAGMDGGIIFAVDLVFSLSAEIDIAGGGFYVTLPDGAYVESSLADGDVSGSSFTGISAKTLPVTVSSGTATFKCDLRLRTQAGIEGEIALVGAGVVVGVYINIIELVTVIETSDTCGLQCREFLDLNVGAFARAAVDVDYKTFGLAPTVSTTLFSLPTATQCISSIASDVASVIGGITGSAASLSATATATASLDYDTINGARLARLAHRGNSTRSAVSSSVTDIGLVASTVLTTKTYTITSCKAAVVNCPASMQTAITVTQTYTNKYANGSNTATATATATAMTDAITLVPYSTPIINTFFPSTTTAFAVVKKQTV